jgi:hypothetical protein
MTKKCRAARLEKNLHSSKNGKAGLQSLKAGWLTMLNFRLPVNKTVIILSVYNKGAVTIDQMNSAFL